MNDTEKMEISLEFDKIKLKWKECALTDAARTVSYTHLRAHET